MLDSEHQRRKAPHVSRCHGIYTSKTLKNCEGCAYAVKSSIEKTSHDKAIEEFLLADSSCPAPQDVIDKTERKRMRRKHPAEETVVAPAAGEIQAGAKKRDVYHKLVWGMQADIGKMRDMAGKHWRGNLFQKNHGKNCAIFMSNSHGPWFKDTYGEGKSVRPGYLGYKCGSVAQALLDERANF